MTRLYDEIQKEISEQEVADSDMYNQEASAPSVGKLYKLLLEDLKLFEGGDKETIVLLHLHAAYKLGMQVKELKLRAAGKLK